MPTVSSWRNQSEATLALMQAWQLTETNGIDAYALGEVDEPEPGPGEVRIKLKVSGLNHLDLWVSQGLPAPHAMPHIGGADGAGVIDAIGPGVSGFEIGDEIIIDPSQSCGHCEFCRNDDIVYCKEFKILGEHLPGTFTEKIVIPTINAVRKPESIDWDVAGSFGLANVTALRMLERSKLLPGENLLVVGVGGGVSAAAMQLGLAFRANVFVTSRSQEKIDWAISQGATAGFDSDGDFHKEMAEHSGAHVVVENVGPATFKKSMRAARPGGRIAVCGATSGAKVDLTMPHLFFKQLEILGSSMGTHAQFARATNWVRLGKVSPKVGKVFEFADLPDALRYLDSSEQIGKVALSNPH